MLNRKPARPPDERPVLNARQTAFVNYYVIDFNATQAVIKAGYSEKGASQKGATLLANVKVKAEVERRKSALAARSELTRDWLVKELTEEFAAAREPTIRKSAEGKVLSEVRKPQAVARIGELLARMHGWIEDKPNATNQTLVNFVIQR